MKDDWNYVRRQCDHFTQEECDYIAKSFREGVRASIVARKLKCSSRVIYTHYMRLRGGVRQHIVRGVTAGRPRPRPVIDKAARFYRSNFEPS